MTKEIRSIRSALVPMGLHVEGLQALALAHIIAEEVLLVGIVPIAEGESISAGSKTVRELRQHLLSLGRSNKRDKSKVFISHSPWEELKNVIHDEEPDILIVEWKDGTTTWGASISEVLASPVCNVAIVRGTLSAPPEQTLIAVRGGPYAELALQLGMSLNSKQLDVLHINITGAKTDAPFKGMKYILKQLPKVNFRSITTSDAVPTILEESSRYDAVVLGTTAHQTTNGGSVMGPVAEKLLRDSSSTIIIVRTRRPMSEAMLDERAGVNAISILVDKWFAENTFRSDEFSILEDLMALKEKQGTTISLALPALNEEQTVGKVITTVKKALMEEYPLLDEIVLMDSNSTDRTREIAKDLGVPVYIHQHLLPDMEPRAGKGEALWKSLLVTKGDIIAWIDTDIVNIHPRFVYGIIGPLLLNRGVQFVKGFYRRPLRVGNKIQAGGGGRVTELTARPLLKSFLSRTFGDHSAPFRRICGSPRSPGAGNLLLRLWRGNRAAH